MEAAFRARVSEVYLNIFNTLQTVCATYKFELVHCSVNFHRHKFATSHYVFTCGFVNYK